MPTYQIRALFHGYGPECGLRLVEADDAESALLDFLRSELSEEYPPGVPQTWVVPEHIAASNGTSQYVAGNVTYRAVEAKETHE